MRRLLMGTVVFEMSCVAMARGADKLPPLDPARVASGRTIYQQYCASCHGADAQGAPNWQERDEHGELPAPPHDAEGHTWRHSDAELYEMVSTGWRDLFNKTRRLTMPGFADVLSPREIRAVITYLKTLWTPEQRRFQLQESQDHPFPSAGR
jgi:mono/diheme cytochrome c family protein